MPQIYEAVMINDSMALIRRKDYGQDICLTFVTLADPDATPLLVAASTVKKLLTSSVLRELVLAITKPLVIPAAADLAYICPVDDEIIDRAIYERYPELLQVRALVIATYQDNVVLVGAIYK